MNPTPTRDELIDLALGRLAPRQREVVERRLAVEPDARARYEAVRAHLARYEAWPEAAAPAFGRVRARLPQQKTGFVPYPLAARLAAGALLAVLLVSLGLALFLGGEAAPYVRYGAHVRAVGPVAPDDPLGPGDRLVAEAPDRVWIGPRVEAVLDRDAELMLLVEEDAVALVKGRAFFRVAPGPFRVYCGDDVVEVTGTVFEVSVEGVLDVAVEEGSVAVGRRRRIVRAGERLLGDRPVPQQGPLGAFFRRPVLDVEAAERLRAGRGLAFRFTLTNPGPDPIALARPDERQVALWLSFSEANDTWGPEVPVPGAALAFREGGPEGSIRLAPRSSRTWVGRIDDPGLEPGSYRCLALYRPQDEAPVVSHEIHLEVWE